MKMDLMEVMEQGWWIAQGIGIVGAYGGTIAFLMYVVADAAGRLA